MIKGILRSTPPPSPQPTTPTPLSCPTKCVRRGNLQFLNFFGCTLTRTTVKIGESPPVRVILRHSYPNPRREKKRRSEEDSLADIRKWEPWHGSQRCSFPSRSPASHYLCGTSARHTDCEVNGKSGGRICRLILSQRNSR